MHLLQAPPVRPGLPHNLNKVTVLQHISDRRTLQHVLGDTGGQGCTISVVSVPRTGDMLRTPPSFMYTDNLKKTKIAAEPFISPYRRLIHKCN